MSAIVLVGTMGIYAIKPAFQRTLRPVEDLLVRLRVHPTIINLVGLAVTLAAAACIVLSPHRPWVLVLVPILANTRTACNALDGLVSRRLGVASRFGEVLNELIDRISDASIFIAVYALAATDHYLALATLVAILINSYLSILSKAAGGSRQYGGLMGKADRMIYLSIASLLVLITGAASLWNWFLAFTLIGALITFTQRLRATYLELQR